MRRIPLICTTTVEIPLILQIQSRPRFCIYEEHEDGDIEALYLPYFEKRDSDKKID